MAYRVDSAPTNYWGSQRFYRETPLSTNKNYVKYSTTQLLSVLMFC